MAFIVEDETGLATANAYISVAEFETYWTDRGFVHSAYTSAQKQVAIIKATDYVEARFRVLFKGDREFATQALSFPRVNLYDEDGQLIEGLPVRLKYAIAEYAKRALTADLLADPTVDEHGLGITGIREKVGPIETETQFSGGAPSIFKPYPMADRYLQEYIMSAGGRVERA